jgi:hypothetical protein
MTEKAQNVFLGAPHGLAWARNDESKVAVLLKPVPAEAALRAALRAFVADHMFRYAARQLPLSDHRFCFFSSRCGIQFGHIGGIVPRSSHALLITSAEVPTHSAQS